MQQLQTASLFCGGGGEMAGKRLAFQELGIPVERCDNLAVNHWEIAVLASRRNFPRYDVRQEDLTEVTASSLGIKHLDMLWASPSCVHFSLARGGVPCDEQQRSHADEVIDRWLAQADVPLFLLENVREFQSWGPLLRQDTVIDGKLHKAGRPDPEKKGLYFQRFVQRLRDLGYTVDWRVLQACDFGDPTRRERLFLQATKDGVISWPEPTHGRPGLPPWRTAADCIDWQDAGESIFGRKKPLVANSLKRIKYGLKTFGLAPFLRCLTHTKSDMPGSSVDDPMPTVTTAKGGEYALMRPVVIKNYGGNCTNPAASIDDPLPTVTATDHNAIATPFVMHATHDGQRRVHPTTEPLPTVTCAHRGELALTEPCLLELRGTADAQLRSTSRPASEPLGTVTAGGGHHALLRPFLTEYYGTALATDLDEPMLTATTKARHALVQLVERLGGPDNLPVVRSVEDLDKLDLSTPFCIEHDGQRYVVDILYRMLRPRELASAMGFPADYVFETPDGKKLTTTDAIKLIGNACPVNTVKAIIKAAVLARPQAFGLKAA